MAALAQETVTGRALTLKYALLLPAGLQHSLHAAHVSLLYRAFPEMGIAEEGKSGNSPAPAPAGPTGTHLQSVEDMLSHLKKNKLNEGRPIKTHRSSTQSDNVCLVGENSGRIKWIQPSGECHCLSKQLHCLPVCLR